MNTYQMVTNRIIEQLKEGVIPWNKPWTGSPNGAFNRVSKIPYSLLNQMLLKHTGEYATYNQWNKLGGRVKKGAKSEFVVFWKQYPVKKQIINTETGEIEEIIQSIPLLKYWDVFHISQVEGVDPLETNLKDNAPVYSAEDLIKTYTEREGIKFKTEVSDEAYYSPLTDTIHLPKIEQFRSTEKYYATCFHEMTHSTGHKTRLNRNIKNHFGDKAYSKEELVAEIGSANLMNLLNIETKGTINNTAAYIQSWLTALENDAMLIVSASSKAEKATKYILGEL